ncbi:MAG: hypothetical protein COB85_05765 [Bacteroidetes bacterium]|nr:MAG: hypothetical protein COB85_05765 [Bacteroidota bacterium]
MEMSTREEQNILIEEDWDIYWDNKDKSSNVVYDFLAGIYRRMVVKNILNHFIKKYFAQGTIALHAGCGSGQVDEDIAGYMDITALDISAKALKIYKGIHGDNCKTVQGNIFDLPFEEKSYQGLYNLGVMEHFTQEEIHEILGEFHRVLTDDGRLIILWPPVFGFTVFILDSAHFILNKIFRMNIKLHPDEITRVKSKKHAVDTLERAGFNVIKYYFGPKDIFTQVVVVAEKK